MHLEIDSELNYNVREERADPIIFSPLVNIFEVEEQSIIESF